MLCTCWPSSGDSSLHGKISLTTSSSPDGLWQLTLAILANDTTFALAKQQKSLNSFGKVVLDNHIALDYMLAEKV